MDRRELEHNIRELRELLNLAPDWDGEGSLPFEGPFIQEMIRLLSALPVQPELGPTGRGSIYLEYGSRRADSRYLGLEVFAGDMPALVYEKRPSLPPIKITVPKAGIPAYVMEEIEKNNRAKE